MYNKEVYKNELSTIAKTFSSFVKESGIEDFAEEANNSLPDRAHTFLTHALDVRWASLQKYHLDILKDIAINPFRKRSETVSLDLLTLFNAGYSTASDIEITQDFLHQDSIIWYEFQWDVVKPSTQRYSIWNLAITYPATSSPELYQALSPSGLLCPWNLTDDTIFATSKSIADRLAYDIYQKDTSAQFSNVRRWWDHRYQSWITWLANLISWIFSNHLLGKKTTVWLYMTAEPDFLIRKNHERLSELLDWLITAKIVRNTNIEYSVEN